MENAIAPAQSPTFTFQLPYVCRCHFTKFVNLHFRQGVDADTTYRLIQDELSLGESTMSIHGISGGNISVDGSPILNLASFVQTYMPPMADKLVKENISKNLVGASTFHFGMVSYNSTHLTIRCRRIPGDSWGSYCIVVQLLINVSLTKSYCIYAVSWSEYWFHNLISRVYQVCLWLRICGMHLRLSKLLVLLQLDHLRLFSLAASLWRNYGNRSERWPGRVFMRLGKVSIHFISVI